MRPQPDGAAQPGAGALDGAPDGALAAALAVLGRATQRRGTTAVPTSTSPTSTSPTSTSPTSTSPTSTPPTSTSPSTPTRAPGPRPPATPAHPDPAGVRMRRLAGDLHDGAIQELLVAGYDLVELTETADLPPAARQLLERVSARIDDAYDQLRHVLTEMSDEDDPTDPDLPLLDALRACTSGPLVPDRVRMEITGPDGAEPSGASRDVIIRAVREGLINVRKHANATQVLVTIGRGRRWWRIDVDDDGTGDEHELRRGLTVRKPATFGLPSLATDAAMVGGRMWVGAAPDLGGIRVSTSVPTSRRS